MYPSAQSSTARPKGLAGLDGVYPNLVPLGVAHDLVDRKELGTRLKGARAVAGLTLSQVAKVLNSEGFKSASKATVGHWETGVSLPDIFVLLRLSQLYRQPLASLVYETALSQEALQFAVEFDSLTEEKKRTLRAIWVAYVSTGNTANGIPDAPGTKSPPDTQEN